MLKDPPHPAQQELRLSDKLKDMAVQTLWEKYGALSFDFQSIESFLGYELTAISNSVIQ